MKWYEPIFYAATDGGGSASDTVTDDVAKPAGDGKDTKADEKPDTDKPDDTSKGKYTDADIAKLKAEHEKQLNEAITKAEEETLKKAGMKPDEKAEYERTQKEDELNRRDQEASLRELRFDALDMLADKQLDKGFIDFVIGSDKEGTAKKIDALSSMFDKAVQAQVEVRLKGKTPPADSPPPEGDSIRNSFRDAMGGY